MESESPACGGCFTPYNTKDRVPRILMHCGHTLCSHCLSRILSTKNERKCPLDNLAFNEGQDSIEKFPANSALLALVKERNQEICPAHEKKLEIFCEQDKMKICYDCALFGEHKGHKVNKIKEPIAEKDETKKDLQERRMKFAKSPQDVEVLKKRSFSQMEQKFGEINRLLKAKKQEWRNQMESFFGKSANKPLSKKEASPALVEIDKVCHTDENLEQMNRDFSVIISRLQPQNIKEDMSKLSAKAIESSTLTIQEKSTKMSKDGIKQEQQCPKEQEKQLPASLEYLIETKQKLALFNSILKFGDLPRTLKIWIGDSNPINQLVHLDEFQDKKKVDVLLDEYDSLFKHSNNIDYLSQILGELKSYTSLVVGFQDQSLTDDRAIDILNALFPRIQHLVDIEISFEQCEIINQSVSFFCAEILPKATSLRHFTLKLSSTETSDISLFALAQSLSSLRKNLETLTLEIKHTAVTDEGIEQIFSVVEEVKELSLNLKDTEVTDRSLKLLGNNVMPCMKNLKIFNLDVSETNITLEGVDAIFAGIPKDISELSLDFYKINMPDKVASLIEEKLCPKLESVETVYLGFEGSDLEAKVSKILRRVKRDAQQRKKLCSR